MSEQNVVVKKSFFPPDRSLYTPFNMVCGVILLVGLLLTVMRFTGGLAAVTNLDDNYPWGLWIGFDLMAGVALAAGGYTTSAACYIFGMKRFHSAVRPAILTGFLGYALVVFSLNYDVGRPWRLPYPFAVQRGTTSLLFEVAACVALYLTVLFLEYSPAALEWLGFKKLRNTLVKITMVLTIFGVVLSTLHTIDAGQTINRILGMFEQEEQPQIRNRLVDTVRWIVSQRLLPRVGGGRVAAMEILCTSLRVKDLILNGETEDKTFYHVINEGSALDMRTFDQHILELFSRGVITEKNAITYCSHRAELNRGLDRIKAERGEATTSLTDLSMEEEQEDNYGFYGR